MRGYLGPAPIHSFTKVARGQHDHHSDSSVVRWTMLAVIVLIAAAIAAVALRPEGNPERQARTDNAPAGPVPVPIGVPIGGPFGLIDDKGRVVTDADYR